MGQSEKKSWIEKNWGWIPLVVVVLMIVGGFWHEALFGVNDKEDTETNNSLGEYIKVCLTIAGGLFVLWGLWLNQRRTKAIEKQNENYREQNENFQKQNEIALHGNVDNRFKNAIEHLGSEKAAIVLGGVYELYRIADEEKCLADKEKRYTKPVFDILCSYLRQTTIPADGSDGAEKVSIVTQTILDVLFNRFVNNNIFKDQANLTGVCLRQAELSNTNLLGANFTDADFTSATIEGNANLKYAILNGAHLEMAKLDSAHFEGAYFEGAHLKNVDFSKAYINDETEFDGADMDETTIFSVSQLKELGNVQEAVALAQKARDEAIAATNTHKFTDDKTSPE